MCVSFPFSFSFQQCSASFLASSGNDFFGAPSSQQVPPSSISSGFGGFGGDDAFGEFSAPPAQASPIHPINPVSLDTSSNFGLSTTGGDLFGDFAAIDPIPTTALAPVPATSFQQVPPPLDFGTSAGGGFGLMGDDIFGTSFASPATPVSALTSTPSKTALNRSMDAIKTRSRT
jgi:hypothetical protein